MIAEHLRIGTWDLVKGLSHGRDDDFAPRFAMQIINEASLCKTRIRSNNYINSQGFNLLNGMSVLASDNHIHDFLDSHTVAQAVELQDSLAIIRNNRGHYSGQNVAVDPHRIISSTKRIAQKKKKQANKTPEKMLQTFFANDSSTGQPICFNIGSSSKNTTRATLELLERVSKIKPKALILADKEHYTSKLFEQTKKDHGFELLVPVISSKRTREIERKIKYSRMWPGYAVAETTFAFSGKKEIFRLLVQREGENKENYTYKSFLTLSDKPAQDLMTKHYGERWSIEEFFNFDGAIGFDKAGTQNLNVRYNKMTLALIAQAASYEFRKKLPQTYKKWNAEHLADAVFSNIDGDIRVEKDTIIVTCYNAPEEFKLKQNYQNLPEKLAKEGIDPKIPWLYNFKIDFRFK